MLKKIIIVLVLLAIVASAYFYLNGTPGNTQTTENEPVIEEVELTETEADAIDILNGEIMMDECTAYAVEDKVPEAELKQYLESCVEQLKLQDSMIPPADGEEIVPPPTEGVIKETNSEVNPPKIIEVAPAVGPTIDAASQSSQASKSPEAGATEKKEETKTESSEKNDS